MEAVMEYIDVKTASEKWGLTVQRITTLCRNGRIDGAKKQGNNWIIPIFAKNNPSSIYSFLLMTGYLKVASTDDWQIGSLFCNVKIPNKEILSVYKKYFDIAF